MLLYCIKKEHFKAVFKYQIHLTDHDRREKNTRAFLSMFSFKATILGHALFCFHIDIANKEDIIATSTTNLRNVIINMTTSNVVRREQVKCFQSFNFELTTKILTYIKLK
jgi:hypothetical protein